MRSPFVLVVSLCALAPCPCSAHGGATSADPEGAEEALRCDGSREEVWLFR